MQYEDEPIDKTFGISSSTVYRQSSHTDMPDFVYIAHPLRLAAIPLAANCIPYPLPAICCSRYLPLRISPTRSTRSWLGMWQFDGV